MHLSSLTIPRHICPVTELSTHQQEEMREWANNFGRAVRQRSVRQDTTMHKARTLPLNMYRNVPAMANGIVKFPEFRPQQQEGQEVLQPQHNQVQGNQHTQGIQDDQQPPRCQEPPAQEYVQTDEFDMTDSDSDDSDHTQTMLIL